MTRVYSIEMVPQIDNDRKDSYALAGVEPPSFDEEVTSKPSIPLTSSVTPILKFEHFLRCTAQGVGIKHVQSSPGQPNYIVLARPSNLPFGTHRSLTPNDQLLSFPLFVEKKSIQVRNGSKGFLRTYDYDVAEAAGVILVFSAKAKPPTERSAEKRRRKKTKEGSTTLDDAEDKPTSTIWWRIRGSSNSGPFDSKGCHFLDNLYSSVDVFRSYKWSERNPHWDGALRPSRPGCVTPEDRDWDYELEDDEVDEDGAIVVGTAIGSSSGEIEGEQEGDVPMEEAGMEAT